MEGLLPPRPARAVDTLGAAYVQICKVVSERLLEMPAAERGRRFVAARQLYELHNSGPAGCMVPAALKLLQDAEIHGLQPPLEAFELLVGIDVESVVYTSSEAATRELKVAVYEAMHLASVRRGSS